MKKPLLLLLAALALRVFVPSTEAALIGRYKLDSASGLQLDSSGVSPAADAYQQAAASLNHLYNQPGVPGGTYGLLTIPAGTITASAGFASTVPIATTDHWLVSTTAASSTVTAPARYNSLVNNFTVMGWIKPTVAKTQRIFSTQVNGVTNHSWGFGMTNTLKLRFTDFAQYDSDTTPTPVVLNTWQHIAVTKSTTGIRYYHNGALVFTDTTAARLGNVVPATGIGSGTNWRLLNGPNNEIFLGLAADIRIYDTVLSQAEVQLAAGHLPTPTGVLATDFSPSINPFLGFSHGVKASTGASSISLFTATASSSTNKPANRITNAGDTLWVGKAPVTVGGAAFPAAGGTATDWLVDSMYHSWSGGTTDILTTRCTVSTAGYYDVAASWKSHTQTGTKAQVFAVVNGTTVFSGAIDGYNGTPVSTVPAFGPAQTASYSAPGQLLAAGDVIDIITIPDATTPAGNLALTFSVVPGTAPVTTTGLVISEFVASNSRGLKDEDGALPDWIELYNGSGAAIDLTGWSLTDNAALPRKWMFPARTIPHGGFLVVFASNKDAAKRPFYTATSELHTNFQLTGAGEYLGVVDAAGAIVDEFTPKFPAQVADVAYGRAGSVGALGYLTPTPNRINGSIASAPPGTITFSVPSGTFAPAAPQSVELSVTPAGQTIRYTTNNTEPTLASGSTFTTGTPIPVTTTTVIRARAFVDGIGGPMAEARYLFVDPAVQPDALDTYHLPVVVIHTLGGGTLGDFTNATEDLQKAALVAVYEPDITGKTTLTSAPTLLTRGGSHTRGQSSSTYKKQGLDLEFWDELGLDRSVPLLGLPSNGDWALYAPYEFDRTYMNNRLTYEWAARMGRYAPRTKFVEVYVNTTGGALASTDYYGIYVLSESIERDKDRIDVASLNPSQNSTPDVSGGYIISINKSNEAETVIGSGLTYMRHMRQFTSNITLTGGMLTFLDYPEITAVTPAQLSYIEAYLKTVEDSIYGPAFRHPVTNLPYSNYIGVDTFIDFHLAQTIPQNIDALRLSSFFYKERNGKLKAGPVWDFDRSMASRDSRNANPSVWETTNLDKTEYFHYGWWHKLFQDPDFMQLWIDRYAGFRRPGQIYDVTGTVAPLIDAYAAEVAPAGSTVNATSRDYSRWFLGAPLPGTGLSNARGTYAAEVAALKTWLQNRFTFIDSQILATPAPTVAPGIVAVGAPLGFTLTGASGSAQILVTTDGSDPRLPGGAVNPAATVLASSGTISVGSSSLVRFRQLDTTVPAFNSNLTSTKMSTWSALGEAYYIADALRPVAGDLTISQLHYHPADPSPAEITAGFTDSDNFEFFQLLNISSHRVNLEGCRFTAGIDFAVPIGPRTELAPGEAILVVKNLAAFSFRYPGLANSSRVLGEFAGNDNLNNAGETITLTASDGLTTLLTCAYQDAAPWPLDADGLGACLVLRAPFSNPDLSSPYSWRPSLTAGGIPSDRDGQSYSQWKFLNFVPDNTTDADSDGLDPIVEYALGGDPVVASQSLLPAYATQPDGSLQVTFSRPLSADDVRWEVQSCDDLGLWSPAPATITARTFTATAENITLSLPASVAVRRYVRMKFTSVP